MKEQRITKNRPNKRCKMSCSISSRFNSEPGQLISQDMRFIFCDILHWRNRLRLIHDKYCNFHELWKGKEESYLYFQWSLGEQLTHPSSNLVVVFLFIYLFIVSLHTTIWLTFEPWVTPPTLLLNHVKWQDKTRGKDWLGPKVLESKYFIANNLARQI